MTYAESLKTGGKKSARALLSAIGSVPDLANELTVNPFLRAFGKQPLGSTKEQLRGEFDKRISGGKPSSSTEEALYSVPEYAITGLGSGVAKGTGMASKALSNLLKPTISGAVGTAAATKVLSDNPNNVIGGIAASLAPGFVKPSATKAKNMTKIPEKIGDMFRKAKLSPDKQTKILEKVAHNIGDEQILSQQHIQGGELGLKATRIEKEKLDKQFNKLFKKRDAILGDKKDSMVVPAHNASEWMMDQYKNLENASVKKKFLKSPLGENFKTLIGAKHDITTKEVDNLVHLNPNKLIDRSKLSYHDTNEVLDKIYDKLSNASEIGTKEQGKLKKLSSMLKKNMDNTIKENVDPKDYKFIKRVNSRYKSFATNQKQTFNHILDENAADLQNVYKKVKETKPYLPTNKFIAKNLSEAEREQLANTYLRDLGASEGKLSPELLSKNLKNLQSTESNYIKGLLPESQQNNLSHQLGIADQLSKSKTEPSLTNVLFPSWKKKFTATAGMLDKGKSTENTIRMLERDMAPKSKQVIPGMTTNASILQPMTYRSEVNDVDSLSDSEILSLLGQQESSPDINSLSDAEILELLG